MPVNFELSLQGTLIYTEIPYTQKSDGLGRKVDLRQNTPHSFKNAIGLFVTLVGVLGKFYLLLCLCCFCFVISRISN